MLAVRLSRRTAGNVDIDEWMRQAGESLHGAEGPSIATRAEQCLRGINFKPPPFGIRGSVRLLRMGIAVVSNFPTTQFK